MNSANKTDDNQIKRNVWNYYNRINLMAWATEGTSHTYNGAARLWNNSEINNRLEFVVGIAEEPVLYTLRISAKAGADGNYTNTYIGTDGTSDSGVNRNVANWNNQTIICGDAFHWSVGIGFHYINVYELSNHADSTFANMYFQVAIRG